MARPTHIGDPIHGFGVVNVGIGQDPDDIIGEVPVPTDHADDAGWFIPVESLGSIALANSDSETSTSETFSWGFTPTSGNLLIIATAVRNGGNSPAPTGWTLVEENTEPLGAAFDDGVAIYAKVSIGSETSASFTWSTGTPQVHYIIMEVSGVSLAGVLDNETTSSGTSVQTGSVTPTAGAAAFIVGVSALNGDSSATHTPGAGWTELYDADFGGEHPHVSVIYQIVATASGSYNPETTASASRNWRGVTAAFWTVGDAVWIVAPSVNDDDDATFDYVDDGAVTETGGDFLRGTLALPVVLASATIRVGLENAGSATIEVDGANASDYSDAVEIGSTTFSGTGSYTAQDVVITLAGTDGYAYIRFRLGAAQGIHVHEVELAGVPTGISDHGMLSGLADNDHPQYALDSDFDAHIADTTDAHDASSISVLDTAAVFTATDVEAALKELYDSISGGGIPATIVDAKGDLIVATAADTVARKAAGANDTILMADSSTGDGLKWVASQTPSTLDYDDTAAEGTADTYARGDHVHGMPSAGGGGSGTTWEQVVDENGTSYANFTTVSGTWASDGTTINQTDTGESFRLARLGGTMVPSGFATILQTDIRFPSAGQPGSSFKYAAIMLGVLAVIIDKQNNLVRWQVWSVSDVATVAFTPSYDTWYTLRVVMTGGRASAYIGGSLLGTRLNLTSSPTVDDFIALGSYGAIANFRNIKVWVLSGGDPA